MKFQKLLLLLAGLLMAAGLSAMQPLGPGLADTDYSDYPSSESESDIEETPVMKKAADQPIQRMVRGETKPLQYVPNPADIDRPTVHSVGLAPLKEQQSLEKAGEYYSEKPRRYPALPQNLFDQSGSTIAPAVRPIPTTYSTGDYDKQPWYGVGLAPLKGKDIRPYPIISSDYDKPHAWKDAIPAPAALEMEKPALKYTTRPQSPVTVVEPQAVVPAPEEPLSAGSFYSGSQKPAQQSSVNIMQQTTQQLPAITTTPATPRGSISTQEPLPAASFYTAPKSASQLPPLPQLPVTPIKTYEDQPLKLPAQKTIPAIIQPISAVDYNVQPQQKAAVAPSALTQTSATPKAAVATPAPQLPVTPVQQPSYTAHPVSPVTVSQPAAPAPQPVVSPQPAAQSTGIIAMLLGRARQHSEFEIAITNSSNETYRLEHNGQSLALAPGQRQQVNLENLPTKALQPIVRTRIVAGREVSRTSTQRTYDAQPIKLVNVANNQQYVLALTRNVNAKGQITIAATIGQGANLIRTKSLTFSPPAAGQRVYYVINVNLQGEGLNQTTFDITPTLAQ